MTAEFTEYCNNYYKLTNRLARRNQHLTYLLNNAPLYAGQTQLSQIDEIIDYYRNVQQHKAKTDQTLDDLNKTGRIILMIMRHFEIPPGTILTGQMEGELEYELWADESDELHIQKTTDLQAPADSRNVILIKFWDEDEEKAED